MAHQKNSKQTLDVYGDGISSETSHSRGSPQQQSNGNDEAGESFNFDPLTDSIGRDLSIVRPVGCSRSIEEKEYLLVIYCNPCAWKVFNLNSRKWIHLPKMKPEECFVFNNSLVVDTELLVFGQERTSHVIYRYCSLTNSWSYGMSMNLSRYGFGSASHGAFAILAGGCDSQGIILSSVEMYDSKAQTWKTLPNMNKPRKCCSVVFMDETFYVIGGLGSGGELLICGERFDFETKKWIQIPDMCLLKMELFYLNYPPFIAVVNNELYMADSQNDKAVLKYDKEKNLWSEVAELPLGELYAFMGCGHCLIAITIHEAIGLDAEYIKIFSWVPSEDGLPYSTDWEYLDWSGGSFETCQVKLMRR